VSAASFFAEVEPHARVASARTGVPASVILAQWGIETGYGTSQAWMAGHNFAGVSAGGAPKHYADRAAGLADYISTLLSPRYAAVRSAASPTAAAEALALSPWDAGHYDGGRLLSSVMERNQLGRFDSSTQLAAAKFPNWIPGVGGKEIPNPLEVPGNIVGAAKDSALAPVRKVALWSIFVMGGVGLVVAGAFTAVRPAAKKALDAGKRVGEAYATGGVSEVA
jgi:hypothetical protein